MKRFYKLTEKTFIIDFNKATFIIRSLWLWYRQKSDGANYGGGNPPQKKFWRKMGVPKMGSWETNFLL